MNYFHSDFLNQLSRFDHRLVCGVHPGEGPLLIESKHLPQIEEESVKKTDLIVLTEEKEEPVFSKYHCVGKKIYKYQKIRHLLAEIFDELHEIRLFLVMNPKAEEALLHHNILTAGYQSRISFYNHSASLLDDALFLEPGRHYLLSSFLDLIDPPGTAILSILNRQAKRDAVDLVCDVMMGDLMRELIRIASVVYSVGNDSHREFASALNAKYRKIIFLNTNNSDQWMSRIIPKRGEDELC